MDIYMEKSSTPKEQSIEHMPFIIVAVSFYQPIGVCVCICVHCALNMLISYGYAVKLQSLMALLKMGFTSFDMSRIILHMCVNATLIVWYDDVMAKKIRFSFQKLQNTHLPHRVVIGHRYWMVM